MTPEVEAEIRYLKTEDGGPSRGICSGYRGQFYYYGRDWDALQQFIDRDICLPGEMVKVHLQTLSSDQHLGMFHIGLEFEIREGSKTVAHGVIRKILRPDFECKVNWSELKDRLYFEDGTLRDI